MMRTPLKYYGGKTRMLPHILPLIPEHRVYVEAFAGGAAVFFAKKSSVIEVLNDINGNVANFYRVCKDPVLFGKLLLKVGGTIHDEFTHNEAQTIYHHAPHNWNKDQQVERAWALWICANMSFGGQLDAKFQSVCNYKDNWSPGVAINNRRKQFAYYAGRLDKVTVLNRDAINIIEQYDDDETFFYLDPPYVGARQGHYEGYQQEHFEQLIDTLKDIKGKFILSSYANEALSLISAREQWTTLEAYQRAGVSSMNRYKTELLTWNYEHTLIKVGEQQTLKI